MTKIFKGILLGSFCLVFVVSGLFVLPRLVGRTPEAEATFGTCQGVYPDNTTNVGSASYDNTGAPDITWDGPLVKITPTEAKVNKFDVVYSQDSLFSSPLTDCYWYHSYMFYSSDRLCNDGYFVAGMAWAGSTQNNRRIYCCKHPSLVGGVDTWEMAYDYAAGAGVTADCSKDASGADKPGGFMVGFKNNGNDYDNVGSVVCRQFGAFPKDLRVTLSCGDLGESYLGRVTCSQGVIKNYGCDLPSNVSYSSSNGLGTVYYVNVTGDTGVTLDNVLSGARWRSGMKCTGAVYAGSVNGPGAGQTTTCTLTNLAAEEQYITFCARAEPEDAAHRGNNCATVLVTANKPDLVVDSVACSTGCTKEGEYYFAALGADVTLEAVIKNRGRAASTEIPQNYRGVTFSIGGSTSPTAYFGLPALAPGATTGVDTGGGPFQDTFSFPTSFTAEDKWVDYKVCADPKGQLGGGGYYDYDGDVLESGGENYGRDEDSSNCKVFRVSALLPNLKVPTFEGPLATVPVGTAQNFTVVAENVGASQSGTTTVKVYKSSGPGSQGEVYSFDLPALGKAGSGTAVSETLQCPFTFEQKGTYRFYARVDDGGLVEEISDLDNNSETITVTADYPNLTVQEMACYPGSPASPGEAGAPITDENFFCTAKVKNTGAAPILENLTDGIRFYAGSSFPGATCWVSGSYWYCSLPTAGSQYCASGLAASAIQGSSNYLVTCEPYFKEQVCQWQTSQYICPAVSGKTPVGPHCSFTLVADSVPPAAADKQEVTCDFSLGPMAMKQAVVCVDPAPEGQTGAIPEKDAAGNPADDDASNCKSVGLTFELPDLFMNNVTCPAGECRAGAGGKWLVENGATFHLTADIRNRSSYGTSKDFDLVYYIDHGSGYQVIDSPNCRLTIEGGIEGDGSWSPTGSCNYSLSKNNPAHLGANKIKVCVDPKGGGAFGAVFEMDDSDSDNCFEKSVAIGGPDLIISSFEPPQYVPLGVNFGFYASVKNQEVSFSSGQIPAEQKGLVYYIKRGGGAWQEIESCRTTVGAVQAGSTWTPAQAQRCNYTIADRVFYTIKACVNEERVQHETDFENNCSEEQTISATVPDFTTYDMKCLPELAHQNQAVTCTVKIRNQAPESLNTPVGVRFYYNREGFDQPMTPFPTELAAVVVGETWQTVANTMSFTEAGPVFFKFKVDPDSKVQEEREDNNEATDEIEVLTVEEFQPDLTVEEGSVKCGYSYAGATADNFTIQLSEERIVCKARVSNIGYTNIQDYFYTTLYTESDYQDFRVVNPGDIILGARPTIKLKFPAGFSFTEDDLVGGGLQVEVVACADRSNLDGGPGDTTGRIAEFKEDNNCAVGPVITVVEEFLPELIVQADSFSCHSRLAQANAVIANEAFSCSAVIQNIGQFNSGALPGGVVINGADTVCNIDLKSLSASGGKQSIDSKIDGCNLMIADVGNGVAVLEICADPADPADFGVIDEFDDHNNCQQVTLAIQEESFTSANLSLLSDSEIFVGDDVALRIEATNNQGLKWVKFQRGALYYPTSDNCQGYGGASSCVEDWTFQEDILGDPVSGYKLRYYGFAWGYQIDGNLEDIYVSSEPSYVEVAVRPRCTDTDPTLEPYTAGLVRHEDATPPVDYSDYCDPAHANGPDTLCQYFCQNNAPQLNCDTSCNYGCENGACRSGAPEPVCGNRIIEQGEECDDGNTEDGDGCSSVCQEEPLPGEDWCSDPDAGDQASFTQSATRDSTGESKIDYCKDEDNVYEYYCTAEDIVSPSPNEIPCAFGCANGACYSEQQPILVTFRVIDAGLNGGTAGAAVGSAKIEIYEAATGKLLNSRIAGVNSGSVSVHLLPGRYKVKVSHQNYVDCAFEDCDIAPSEGDGIIAPSVENNLFAIEMTKIPTLRYTFVLRRGFGNFVAVARGASLTWDEVRGQCPDVFRYFYIYSPDGGWVKTRTIPAGGAGYIPWGVERGFRCPTEEETERTGGCMDACCCIFSQEVPRPEPVPETKTFKKGSSAFMVPKALVVNQILNAPCDVVRDELGLRIAAYESVDIAEMTEEQAREELYDRVGENGTLDPWKPYWIHVREDCTVTW